MSLVCRKRNELDTDLVWSPMVGRTTHKPWICQSPQLFSPLCPKPTMGLLHHVGGCGIRRSYYCYLVAQFRGVIAVAPVVWGLILGLSRTKKSITLVASFSSQVHCAIYPSGFFSNLEWTIPSWSLGNPRRGEVKSPGCHRCVVVFLSLAFFLSFLFKVAFSECRWPCSSEVFLLVHR